MHLLAKFHYIPYVTLNQSKEEYLILLDFHPNYDKGQDKVPYSLQIS
jgi:hypothetical protein